MAARGLVAGRLPGEPGAGSVAGSRGQEGRADRAGAPGAGPSERSRRCVGAEEACAGGELAWHAAEEGSAHAKPAVRRSRGSVRGCGQPVSRWGPAVCSGRGGACSWRPGVPWVSLGQRPRWPRRGAVRAVGCRPGRRAQRDRLRDAAQGGAPAGARCCSSAGWRRRCRAGGAPLPRHSGAWPARPGPTASLPGCRCSDGRGTAARRPGRPGRASRTGRGCDQRPLGPRHTCRVAVKLVGQRQPQLAQSALVVGGDLQDVAGEALGLVGLVEQVIAFGLVQGGGDALERDLLCRCRYFMGRLQGGVAATQGRCRSGQRSRV